MGKQRAITTLGLTLAILLAAFLRFYRLGAYGVGNAYYAATVQSMLTSWHNFFFASFEPGGSVTVDKPPLGFWVQAASAYLFGVNGFALAFPQALAGVLSVSLLYAMVKCQFGAGAGLVAALALATMPVAVAVERNNTVDGLLSLVLLLAAWAFLRAVQYGRLRDLLSAVVLVGLGFNIKMLQAFMPLPAFYALYLFGALPSWWKRIAYLMAATVVLVGVSLSWAIVVDLTPTNERPFIGGSKDNTVMDLIVGYNTLTRLGLSRGQTPGPPPPPGGGTLGPPPPPPGAPNPAQEVGQPGVRRLFIQPLVTEASWLLPFVLLGLLLILSQVGWRWPLSDKYLAVVLWGGWLLPEVVYFSFNRGLFHAHYLVMLGPPLSALVGATTWALGEIHRKRHWLGWMLLALLAGSTIAFQIVTLQRHQGYAMWVVPTSMKLLRQGQRLAALLLMDVWWLAAIAIALLAFGLGTLALRVRRAQAWVNKAALGIAIIATMVAPLLWSALTTFNTKPDGCLPRSGRHIHHTNCLSALPADQRWMLSHLLANTKPGSYLVATLTAYDAALYILATQRPVLPLGGFTGEDSVVDIGKLAQMVQDGRVRFVLEDRDLPWRKPEIAAWLNTNCQRQNGRLYDCGGR